MVSIDFNSCLYIADVYILYVNENNSIIALNSGNHIKMVAIFYEARIIIRCELIGLSRVIYHPRKVRAPRIKVLDNV